MYFGLSVNKNSVNIFLCNLKWKFIQITFFCVHKWRDPYKPCHWHNETVLDDVCLGHGSLFYWLEKALQGFQTGKKFIVRCKNGYLHAPMLSIIISIIIIINSPWGNHAYQQGAQFTHHQYDCFFIMRMAVWRIIEIPQRTPIMWVCT